MPTKTATYGYTGAVQHFTVPNNLIGTTVTVSVKGPGGGYSADQAGGLVSGTLTVTPGETLDVYVGGCGRGPGPLNNAGAQGWGGAVGGIGGTGKTAGSLSGFGGSGSSEIRRAATRLVVAGGAGSTGRQGAGTGATTLAKGGKGGAATSQAGGSGSGTGAGGIGGGAATATTGGSGGDLNGYGGNPPGPGGQGGAGGSVYATSGRGGGGGGGGYSGGGGGGGSGLNRSSGAGAGGSNYSGGLASVTANTQGGGSGPTVNGVVVITWTVPPLQPVLLPPNFGLDSGAYTNMPTQLIFTDGDTPAAALNHGDVRWRLVGAPTWTQVLNIAPPPPNPYVIYYLWQPGALPAGNYEVQARITDITPVTGPWSDSVLFTVAAAPVAAFPYVDLADQWPNATGVGDVTGAAQMVARLDTPIAALAQWASDPLDADPADPTRRASVGVEVSFASPSAGHAVTANTPIKFDQVDNAGRSFPMYDYSSGLVTIPLPGRYLVGAVVVNHSASSGLNAFVAGLPSAYGSPSIQLVAQTDVGQALDALPVVFAGGEQISLQVNGACTVTGDNGTGSATRLWVWRIGA